MNKRIGILLIGITVAGLALAGTACKTARAITNPDGTTITNKVYDPVKTEQTEAAIEPAISLGFHVLFLKNKTHAPEIAKYLSGARDIFCQMEKDRQFSYAYLVAQADKLGTPELVKVLGDENGLYLLTAKELLLSLYRIHLAAKGNVALSDEEWGFHTAKVFCASFTTSLKNEGYQ
jgi:hypothetical protein